MPNPSTPPLPQNREAEENVIGSVLIDPYFFDDLSAILKPDDFYIVKHRWIWEAFIELRQNCQPIEFLTVSDNLDKAGKLAEIGGPSYLTSLLNQVVTSLNCETYAHMVEDCSLRRKLLTGANNIATLAYDIQTPIDDALDLAGCEIADIGRRKAQSVITLQDTCDEASAVIDNPLPQAIPCHFLTTNAQGLPHIHGLEILTEKLGGLPLGQAIILAAPTQTGKTTLAYELAEAAVLSGARALYCSTESTGISLVLKRAMSNLGYSVKLLRKGELTPLQKQDIKDEIERLKALYSSNFAFDDKSHTTSSICASASVFKPDLMVVDHLGELSFEGDNKTLGMGENFRGLRQFSHGRNIALLATQQISIDMTDRPGLKDMRWAKGDLSEQLDICLTMYRPDLALSRSGDEEHQASSIHSRLQPVPVELWIRKDREGSVDVMIPTMFNLTRQTFESATALEQSTMF